MGMFAVETNGLREALSRMEQAERLDAQRELRAEFNQLAAQVITAAQARAGTRSRQRAARTLRPGSTATGAAVWFGRGFDGAFGAEFGAHRGRRRPSPGRRTTVLGWEQFQPWRGGGPAAGYFVWPAIRDETKQATGRMSDRLAEILAGD